MRLIGNSHREVEKSVTIEVLIRQRCNALIVSPALSDDELAQFMDNIPVWC